MQFFKIIIINNIVKLIPNDNKIKISMFNIIFFDKIKYEKSIYFNES